MAEDTTQQTASGDWVIEFDPTGVQPASGKSGGGPAITRSGVYKAMIKSSRRFTSQNGFDTVLFNTQIEGDGEFAGYEQDIIMPGTHDATKDPQGKRWAARWKTLALNIARDPANLEKGKIKFGAGAKSNPVGKSVFIYVRAYPEGTMDPKNPQYAKKPDANFMAPAEAQAELEAEAKLAATGNTGAGTAAAKPNTPAAPAAPAKPAEADPLAEI